MGNEQHIVPISWQAVKEVIFPALADLLNKQPADPAFVERWRESLPAERAANIADDPFATWRDRIPPGYLADIRWSPLLDVLPAEVLRRSPAHRQLGENGGTWPVTDVLRQLLIFIAGVQLPGESRYDDTYWGRILERPELHVAGAKWSWRFLEALYETSYVPYDPARGTGTYYIYQRRGVVSDELYALLDALFLSTRAFPGMALAEAHTWHLAGLVPGYLLPREVRTLADHLPALASLPRVADSGEFKLFADRVERAAQGWIALVTMLE